MKKSLFPLAIAGIFAIGARGVIDNGLYSYSMSRTRPSECNEEFAFQGNNVTIKSLELYTIDSIWL